MYLYLDGLFVLSLVMSFGILLTQWWKSWKNDSMRRQLEGKRSVVCWVNATGIGSVSIDLDTKTLIWIDQQEAAEFQ